MPTWRRIKRHQRQFRFWTSSTGKVWLAPYESPADAERGAAGYGPHISRRETIGETQRSRRSKYFGMFGDGCRLEVKRRIRLPKLWRSFENKPNYRDSRRRLKIDMSARSIPIGDSAQGALHGTLNHWRWTRSHRHFVSKNGHRAAQFGSLLSHEHSHCRSRRTATVGACVRSSAGGLGRDFQRLQG